MICLNLLKVIVALTHVTTDTGLSFPRHIFFFIKKAAQAYKQWVFGRFEVMFNIYLVLLMIQWQWRWNSCDIICKQESADMLAVL